KPGGAYGEAPPGYPRRHVIVTRHVLRARGQVDRCPHLRWQHRQDRLHVMDEAFDLSRFRDVAAALNEGSKQPTVDTVHGVLRRLSGSRRSERRGRDCGPGGGRAASGSGTLVLAAATRALNVSATTTAADPPWNRVSVGD